MTHNQFVAFLDQFCRDLRVLTDGKGIEYANDADQLANFKRLGVKLDLPPSKVAMVYLTKHLDAIEHAVRSGKTLSESFHNRCTDAALYIILLAALQKDATASVIENPPMVPKEWKGGPL